MKRTLILLAAIAVVLTAQAGPFGGGKTINVIPENARILMGGVEVGQGTYVLNLGRDDYKVLRLTCPGYIDKTVRIYKADKSNTYTFRLEEDASFTASDPGSDLANKIVRVNVREGMDRDAVWKRIVYTISDLFPVLEVSDKAAGWIRSAWEIQDFGYVTIRTRIEIKEIPGQDNIMYRLKLQSEWADINCGRDDQCFKQWDRILKRFNEAISDLRNSIE